MTNKGWIKLYRKAKDNPIIRDRTAWALFCWILLSVDRKSGTYKTGRYALSEALKIKPSTIQKALKRLLEKYKMVSAKSSYTHTTIRVLNWEKYQSYPQVIHNSVSRKYQPGITQQELRIKNTTKRKIEEFKKEFFTTHVIN